MDDEALRELPRARAETIRDLQDAHGRLTAVFLRPESRSAGRAPGGPAPLRWLAAVVGPPPAQPIVLPAEVRAVTEHPARRGRLEPALRAQGTTWRWPPVVDALQALRGGPCTVAVTMGADMGARTRFETPRARMPWLGFVPSAYGSGPRRQQGTMTTTGHPPARRVLVEGAWAYRSPAHVRRQVPRRLAHQPTTLQNLRWQAHVRLGQRAPRLMAKGTHAHVVTVAIARELVGCVWALAQEGPRPLSSTDH